MHIYQAHPRLFFDSLTFLYQNPMFFPEKKQTGQITD